MKNIYKSFMIALAAVFMFTACAEKEGPVDPYSVNWMYIESPVSSSYLLKFTGLGDWISKVDTTQAIKKVRCTKPAASKTNVVVDIDPALVAEYNRINGTEYELLPGASLANKNFVIEKGGYISADTIKVVHGGFDQIIESGSKKYVLPISIKSFNGDFTRSEQANLYLVYDAVAVYHEVVSSTQGTEITDKTNWTCTTSNGTSFSKVVDGNTGNYQYLISSGSWVSDCQTMTVDMGAVYEIKCLSMHYYAWYYATDGISFEYSTDGVTYQKYYNTDWYANPADYAEFNILFYVPFEARYLKIFNGNESSYDSDYYGTVIKEVRVYTE